MVLTSNHPLAEANMKDNTDTTTTPNTARAQEIAEITKKINEGDYPGPILDRLQRRLRELLNG